MPSRPLSVAVIQGGPSSEAEVSRASAKSIAAALATAGHRAVRLELDAFLAESLRTGAYEVVFPITHGAVGEDGSLQGLLEVLEIPYVGSNVLASALAMNKAVARKLFGLAGLPIARGIDASRANSKETAARILSELGPSVVVKPAAHGSAIGVSRLPNANNESIAAALDVVWKLDDVAIVERFAKGAEVTCGVLAISENGSSPSPRALPPTEVRTPNDDFYSYEARYAKGRSVHLCPPPFSASVIERIQQVAVLAHTTLGCRDLSRVDFIVGDEGNPDAVTLLEVNTLPGFTETSLYPEASAISGTPMTALCDRLVRAAFMRGPSRRTSARPLPG